jgi:hypothetical protein
LSNTAPFLVRAYVPVSDGARWTKVMGNISRAGSDVAVFEVLLSPPDGESATQAAPSEATEQD